jgi:hypothetical protein
MPIQHTPGPWEARPFLTPNEDDDPLGIYIIDKATDLTNRYHKAMDLEAGSHEEQAYLDAIHLENAANARLISTAPELLELCEEALRALQHEDNFPILKDKLRAAIDKVRVRKPYSVTRRSRHRPTNPPWINPEDDPEGGPEDGP